MAMVLHQGFLNTAPLWINRQFGITQFSFPSIDLTSFKAKPLPARLRLGHQMEHIFKQLIDHSSYYTIRIANLPLKVRNRTIGEIDFILQNNSTKQLLHVELTYKFYVIDPSITEPVHQLVGPNRRDMFFTKMEKIKQRQFPIIHSDQGKSALLQNGIANEDIEPQCCYKAQLFVPYFQPKVHIRPLNQHCIQGFWLKFEEFNTTEFRAFTYYIPYKSEWVITPQLDRPWQSHYEMLMELNLRMLKENAPMIWVRKPKGVIEKGFVVWW